MRAIVELFIRWIHLVAGIVWFSGIFFSAFIATPILMRNGSKIEALQHIASIRYGLRRIIRVTIHVLLITGAMNVFIVGLNTKMDFSQRYVSLFLIKMGFVGLMTLFHILHVSVFGRKLEAAVSTLKTDDVNLPPPVARLHRQTQLFALLTILSGLAAFAFSLSLKVA